jgi:hypothetical protein
MALVNYNIPLNTIGSDLLLTKFFHIFLRITTYLILLSASSNSMAEIADEMKALIEQGKPKQAYELGLNHPELMGDPLFDYAFGVAAVDDGRASLGVLALERVLLQNPSDDLVRLELARAYYQLEDYERAKDEFLTVQSHKPPASVISTINLYLAEIARKQRAQRISGSIFAEVGAGYNNNVNTAAAINNIILPFYGPVELSSTSKPQTSPFSYLSAGGNIDIPVSPGVTSFSSISTSSQRYSQVDGYDLNVSNGLTGLKMTDDVNTVKVVAYASVAKLDQVPVPNAYGGGAQYERLLLPNHMATAALGSTVLDYGSQYSVYNATLNTGALGYRWAFPNTTWAPVVVFGASYSQQNNTQNRPDLSRNITGGTVAAYFLPSDKWGLQIGGGYASSTYGAPDLLYGQNRTDGLFSAQGTLEYKLTKSWSTRAELTYYKNNSNLTLYSFSQYTGALKLRYEWQSN